MHSVIFYSILLTMIVGNLLWWRHANRLAARMSRPRAWRCAIGLWSGTMAFCILLVILSRAISGEIVDWVPQPIVAGVYIWHVLFALEWLCWRIGLRAVRAIVGRLKGDRTTSAPPAAPASKLSPAAQSRNAPLNADPRVPDSQGTPPRVIPVAASSTEAFDSPEMLASAMSTFGASGAAPAAPSNVSAEPILFSSRRQFLTAAALATPPALVTLGAWRAVSQFDLFRVNTITLRIPNLPPALDGLRIAHVSDIHIGKFSDDTLLKAVVERTNAMRPDLILYTGDLIDFDLADLPAGLSVLKQWDPKFGLCMCEGNHDLMMGRIAFEQQVTNAGFPMPINATHSVTVRGQEVQLLGLRWGGPDLSELTGGASDRDISGSVRKLIPQIHPGAFPILLAHHPHAFDFVGDANIPLTLAGHTHGGQINLGPIHPALLRFRYLSGLYKKPDGKQMFVSNGVGNWFPLRINAPAEIGDITLQAV